MTSEQKKIIKLNQYKKTLQWVDFLEAQAEEIRTHLEGVGAQLIDGMPRSSQNRDNSELIDRLDELEKKITKAILKALKECSMLFDAVNDLSDPILQLDISYRYIDGLSAKETAEKLGYCERHERRLHLMAIKKIKI